jgi:hypothetical protein
MSSKKKTTQHKIMGSWCPVDILFDPKQFWMLLFLGAMFSILGLDVLYHINSSYYLNFLTFLGSFFIGGQHLLEWTKANQTNTENDNQQVVSNNIVSANINNSRDPKDFPIDYKAFLNWKRNQ